MIICFKVYKRIRNIVCIACLTDRICNVNLVINYQVSQIQEVRAVEIKPIEAQMSTLGIKTSNQVGRYVHAHGFCKTGNAVTTKATACTVIVG